METMNKEIRLTAKAISEIKHIMEENDMPSSYGVRVAVKGGGCSGLTYVLNFDAEPKEGDTIIQEEDVKLFIDGKSLFYLTGTELDYSSGLNGKGFIFNNPNASKTCGCGESFGV